VNQRRQDKETQTDIGQASVAHQEGARRGRGGGLGGRGTTDDDALDVAEGGLEHRQSVRTRA
jgi:hypothetical protein